MARELMVCVFVLFVLPRAAASQTPVQSFGNLLKIVKPGQRLIVRDEAGRRFEGRLVSINSDQLELSIPLFLLSTTETIAADMVWRIDVRDSTANGFIGLGVSSVLAGILVATCEPGGGCELLTTYIVVPGTVIGGANDHFVNRRIYVPPRSRGVALGPILGPSQAGIAARIGF
jgi:hypothetical protein